MQIQIIPLSTAPNPRTVTDYYETFAGFEAQIVAESATSPGFNVILGENLDATDQTEKIVHAVAANGYLLASNLPPHE